MCPIYKQGYQHELLAPLFPLSLPATLCYVLSDSLRNAESLTVFSIAKILFWNSKFTPLHWRVSDISLFCKLVYFSIRLPIATVAQFSAQLLELIKLELGVADIDIEWHVFHKRNAAYQKRYITLRGCGGHLWNLNILPEVAPLGLPWPYLCPPHTPTLPVC